MRGFGFYTILYFILGLFHDRLSIAFGQSDCCNAQTEMENCSGILDIPLPETKKYGYDFVIGPLKSADSICETNQKSIIELYECAGQTCQEKCQTTPALKYLYQNLFETKGLKKAATYLCGNVELFRKHKNGCLLRLENEATKCILKNDNKEFLKLLEILPTTEHELREKIRKALNKDRCDKLILKIQCLDKLLSRECSRQVVALIVNYFRETRPSEECKIDSILDSNKIEYLQLNTLDLRNDPLQNKLVQNDFPPTKVQPDSGSQIEFSMFLSILSLSIYRIL